MSENNLIPKEANENEVYELIRAALAESRRKVIAATNTTTVGVYWEIGLHINEAVGERAEYGRGLASKWRLKTTDFITPILYLPTSSWASRPSMS